MEELGDDVLRGKAMARTGAFEVVEVTGPLASRRLYDGPPSLAIFYRRQSGLDTFRLRRYLDDLETRKITFIYLLDVEENWDLASELNVEFSPTTLRFDSKREVKRVVGLPSAKVFAGRLGL